MNRVKKFWYDISGKKLTIGNAAIILGATGLLSNILGLWRERVIAGTFGASHMTDAFYASFRLPDMIFNLLILGALSSAFIPVFVEKITAGKKDEANDLASSFLNFIMIAAGLFAVIIFVSADKLVPFLLPGFFNRPEANFDIYNTTVNLTRIMMISPIIFSISGVFGGILNSYKRFVAYSVAPLLYNISIIFSATFLTSRFDPPIYALAVGVIGGAVLHALVQLPSVINTGFRWKPILNFKEGQIGKIIKLMIPRTIAIGVNQINLFIDTVIASFFVGGITILTFANDIQTAPTVIFGVAIATAIFPVLSAASSNNDMKEFMKSFSWSARRILYFTIPATVGLIILRAQVIRLVFGIGEHFDWTATGTTTKALLFFSIGLIAQGLTPLLLKAFYAIQDTKTPLLISIITMVINVALSVSLPFIAPLQLGVTGIALAFSIAGIINAGLLFWFLHGKIGALDPDHKIFESTARLVVASAIMGFVAYYSLRFFDLFVSTEKVLGLFIQTIGSISFAAATYFFLTWLMRCEETRFVLEKLRLAKK